MLNGLITTTEATFSFSDFEIFAKIVANIVTKSVIKYLDSLHFNIFSVIVCALSSAIVYMYLTQKSERKDAESERREANARLFAVLQESTSLMNTVKDGLKNSVNCEKKTRKALREVSNIVKGCISRDTRFDNNSLDCLLDDDDEDCK